MNKTDQTSHPTAPGTPPPAPALRPRRWARFRLYFLLGLLAVVLLLASAWSWLTHPQYLAQFIARRLEPFLHHPVRLTHAHWAPNQPLILENLEILSDSSAPPLLHVRYVLIDLDIAPLLLGRLHIQHLALIEPTFSLPPNIHQHRPALLNRFGSPSSQPTANLPAQFSLPRQILLCSARFQPATLDPPSPTPPFHLLAQLDTATPTTGRYQLTLLQPPPYPRSQPSAVLTASPAPLRLRSSVNLAPLSLQLYLENLSLDQMASPILSPFLPWWKLFDPSGTVRQAQLRFDPIRSWQMNCVLENLALTVPRHDLPSGSRLTAQTARLRLAGNVLIIEHLAGRIDNIDYSLHGRISHLGPVPQADLSIHAAGPFPTDPATIALLPSLTRQYLQRFQPQGLFQLQLHLTGTLGQEKLAASGRVSLQGVHASDSEHPYPLDNLHGHILFNPHSVQFDLSGQTGTDAPVHIYGQVAPPTSDAAIDLHILARDLSLDAQLLAFLAPEHRRIVESFLASPPSSDLPAHHFDLHPRGTLHLQLHLYRPPGPDQPWQVQAQIQPVLLRLAWHAWPYPLIADSGRILLHSSSVQLDQLRLHGPHGGWLLIQGSVQTDADPPHYDLSISAYQIPIDPLLSASLDPAQRHWLALLNPQGSFNAQARIFTPHNSLLSWQIRIDPRSVRIQLQNTTIPLQLLAGHLIIQPDQILLHQLQAQPLIGPSNCLLTLHGTIRYNDPHSSFDLHAEAFYLPLHTLLALIPSNTAPQRQILHRLLNNYPLTGRTHAYLHWLSSPDQLAWNFQLQPLDLTFTFSQQPLTLQFTSGRVLVNPQNILLHNLTANLPSGRIHLTGTITPSSSPSAHLSLQADLQTIDPQLFCLLPSPLARTLQSLHPTGSCRIDPLDLHCSWPSDSDSPLLNLTARLDLTNLSLQHPPAIRNLTGRLNLRWSTHPPPDQPTVQLDLSADQLQVAEHLITNLQAELIQPHSTSTDTQAWQLSHLAGDLAGGKLLGSGSVSLSDPAFYRLSLILENADLDTFLDRRPPHPTAVSSPPASAHLSARLDIESPLAHPSTLSRPPSAPFRRGRGQVRITGARLYQMPLAMSLVQVLNLAWPSFHPFDRIDAHFFLQNDLAYLERLSFHAPRLQITGSGTLNLTDWSLDLDLAARNPAAARLGLLAEAMNLIRDELVSIKVRGTLAAPLTRLQTLPSTRRSWNEIFNP